MWKNPLDRVHVRKSNAMPLNPLVILGSLAAAAMVSVGAASLSGLLANPSGNTIPIAETVILAPGSFMHPRPGEFLKDGHPVAAPLIPADIRNPVEIMKYQVSAQEYERCVEAAACEPVDKPDHGDQPVTGVSHIDAEAYVAWYSHATGQSWRLPSDQEWAYAAAERFTADIEGGKSDPANPAVRWLAQYRTESALDRKPDPTPRTRGSFGVNSKGVADTAGNVWEWTSTCYVRAVVARDGTSITSTIDNCGVSVVEGFHRTYMSNFIRDGKSGGCAVGTPPDNLGFRLVRDQPSFARSVMRRLGIS
jgi:formylglycine-generating enzyme required for sulfatase activity